MAKYKIGSKVTVDKELEIKGFMNKTPVLKVQKGDVGFMDSKGFVHWDSGKARGKIQLVEGAEMEEYDTSNIAELIVKELVDEFAIDMLLEDEDISLKYFKEVVEGVLEEIL